MKLKLLLLSFLLALPAHSARGDTPGQNFLIQCSACHAVDHKLVGPSLVEISGIYGKDPDGFLRWCMKPGKKRPDTIEMPSMAHVGEPALKEIYGYILSAAAGKTEQAVADNSAALENNRRPRVQRIFMPDASPAAIAVALPGDLSFCFDAGDCRLRYVWKGGFIDALDHYKGNGNALAKLKGDVLYREGEFPLSGGSTVSSTPKFLGYSMSEGIPIFRYLRDGVEYSEKITPLPDGSGIQREFTTKGSTALILKPAGKGAVAAASTGEGPIQTNSFTLTYRWK
ncbi:MAG: hypothetical protein JWO82_308 [Akkermansiaceae bacterium]|nr:hypothetical protein [Akkermansiaceae bacterium]